MGLEGKIDYFGMRQIRPPMMSIDTRTKHQSCWNHRLKIWILFKPLIILGYSTVDSMNNEYRLRVYWLSYTMKISYPFYTNKWVLVGLPNV